MARKKSELHAALQFIRTATPELAKEGYAAIQAEYRERFGGTRKKQQSKAQSVRPVGPTLPQVN